MIKNIIYSCIVSFFMISILYAQDPPEYNYDHFIKIKITITESGNYEVFQPTPLELYTGDKVGFKIIVENKSPKPPPYFGIYYDSTHKNITTCTNGSGQPIIIIPPPSGRSTHSINNVYEVIPKHILDLSARNRSLRIELSFSTTNLCSLYRPFTTIQNEFSILDPLPDLDITDENVYSSANNYSIDLFYAECVVVNKNKYPTLSGFSIQYYISKDQVLDKKDQFLTRREITALGPKESKKIRISYRNTLLNTKPRDTYYLLYSVDTDNVIKETNELNNVSNIRLTNRAQKPADIQLSPNPAQNRLLINIETLLDTTSEFYIYNAYGLLKKKIITVPLRKGSEKEYELDISSLPSGLYYCHMNFNENSVVKTFIKQ